MEPALSEERQPAHAQRLGWALAAWTLCGPVVAVGLGMHDATISWLGCPLCGAQGFCVHRVRLMGAVHLAGLIALVVIWTRQARQAGILPTRDDWARRVGLAGVAFAALAVSLLLEWTVDVETVMASGPLLAAFGCSLLSPRGPSWFRAVGGVLLASSLAGFYAVVCFRLSPDEARVPLLVAGLAGLSALIACFGWAWTARPDSPQEEPDRQGRQPE